MGIIETDVDKLLKIVEKQGHIAVNDAAKILKINEENVEGLGKILADNNLIKLGYSPLGKLILKSARI